MIRLVPQMSSVPPDGYVAFVERHLDRLRRDAARVVGDEREADQLYPDVLTDVAARWHWLDLLHTRLNQPEAGERYLRQAFTRRSQRWQPAQVDLVDIQVWRPDAPGAATGSSWSSVTFGPATPSGEVDVDLRVEVRAAAPAPAWSSIALRLAAHVTPPSRIEIGPVAEAAIAWWHAYEARRRRRVVAALAVLFLLVMLAARLQRGG